MVKKLIELIRFPEKIPCDKRMYFMIGSFIFAITYVLTDNYTATIVLAFVSFAIEIFQKETHGGRYDLSDALATTCGSIPILIVILFKG